ncbi:YceD family protein [Anianabacter salinae]|uniref:YceD family protein n=1 Tax=Anianabacter salinae TaxID=2851023 RepID=UPI00225E351C|nr:DUF177 domain-containing protein [Anianabacter salinae]MBV0911907.1 DUF177 domain-containing protein [Anianabacter salinae]
MAQIGKDRLRLSDLPAGETRAFVIEPDASERAAIAADLGILGLRKLRLEGRLIPDGKRDWRLEAVLGATVVQACVVTLDPVSTRIDEAVKRRYSANPPEVPEATEVEMPEDDTVEPLPETLELGAVMREALALALPPFPRKDGIPPVEARFTESGAEPLTDDDVKPFAGLAELRDKLARDKD